jgi:hypothetical protein
MRSLVPRRITDMPALVRNRFSAGSDMIVKMKRHDGNRTSALLTEPIGVRALGGSYGDMFPVSRLAQQEERCFVGCPTFHSGLWPSYAAISLPLTAVPLNVLLGLRVKFHVFLGFKSEASLIPWS